MTDDGRRTLSGPEVIGGLIDLEESLTEGEQNAVDEAIQYIESLQAEVEALKQMALLYRTTDMVRQDPETPVGALRTKAEEELNKALEGLHGRQ